MPVLVGSNLTKTHQAGVWALSRLFEAKNIKYGKATIEPPVSIGDLSFVKPDFFEKHRQHRAHF
jgi:hypothetical protein